MQPNFADKTIWTGDNLDILRGMNSACIDLIYLDPPSNSNQDYAAPIGSKAAGAAFKDTWTLKDLDVAWMGLIADEQPAIANLLHTASLTHGKGMQAYLTMMAVRLLEMRRVLKETGSIYLHCDPTASHYLKLLMDAVFGQGNFKAESTGSEHLLTATRVPLATSAIESCSIAHPESMRTPSAHLYPPRTSRVTIVTMTTMDAAIIHRTT